MLDLYLICWRNFNIAYDCIESLIETASEPIRISVASPNDTLPNSGTEKIRKYLREQVQLGRIHRSLEFEENGFGWSFIKMINDFKPTEPIFFFSDGDMVNINKVDWIGISKKYHEQGKSLTGFNLSTSNYLPPNHGFSSDCTEFGVWLMCAKTDIFLRHFNEDRNTIDGELMAMARHTGGGYKIMEAEMLHATWSIFYEGDRYEDKEYAKLKREQSSNWVFNPRPSNMRYELVEKQ